MGVVSKVSTTDKICDCFKKAHSASKVLIQNHDFVSSKTGRDSIVKIAKLDHTKRTFSYFRVLRLKTLLNQVVVVCQ